MYTPEQIRQAREAKGLSQAALAALVGVSQPAIRKIESGETLNSRHMANILSALGLSSDELDISNLHKTVEGIKKKTDHFYSGLAAREESSMPIWGKDVDLDAGYYSRLGIVYSVDEIERVERPWFLKRSRRAFGIFMEDENMSPIYELGDLLLFDPQLTIVRNKNALFAQVLEKRELANVKIYRVLNWDKLNWFVKQFNPEKEITLNRLEWSTVARAVARVES